MRTTHIYYIRSSRFWSVDLSWYHPNWARDLLITLVIAWHKTSCHNLLCIFFSLHVCYSLPQQIFSLSILLLLFLRYFNHSILLKVQNTSNFNHLLRTHYFHIFMIEIILTWYEDLHFISWGYCNFLYVQNWMKIVPNQIPRTKV